MLTDLHQHLSQKVDPSPKRLTGGSWVIGHVTNALDEVVQADFGKHRGARYCQCSSETRVLVER